jgi:pyruvate dehydrogenase E2 component (dihydrolipoamide acetyltransferase)
MTGALQQLEELRRAGTTATTTHLVIHAAARALAANPALHQLVVGSRRTRPGRVDIGLSIAGETTVAPVLVIEAADQKSVTEIAAETTRRAPEVQREERKKLQTPSRWGGLVPFGFLRRMIMRGLFAGAAFRLRTAGTFQVSSVPVEWAATSIFVASGVLVAGQVWSTVVPVDGVPAVRPVMTLTLSGDHAVWDGRAAARFLAAVRAGLGG